MQRTTFTSTSVTIPTSVGMTHMSCVKSKRRIVVIIGDHRVENVCAGEDAYDYSSS